MKNILWLLMVIILSISISMTGCTEKKSGVNQIIIATLMTHPALDQIVKSMKEELTRQGFKEGENLTITIKNANGEVNLIPTMVQDVKLRQPDLVVVITTPVAQAFSGKITAPMVFSAVTDPVSAGVVKSMDEVTNKVSGVSDAWPYRQQLLLARDLYPQAGKLGVLYNPGESASQYGLKQIRPIAKELGFEIVDMVATKTSEVLSSAQQNIDKVDLIYLSSDNTVIQALPAALKVSLAHKKGLIVGDSGTVEKGGLAAVSVGYAGVGVETGKIVAQFLNGNTQIKPVVAIGDEIYLNQQTAEKIGLTISDSLIKKATKVY